MTVSLIFHPHKCFPPRKGAVKFDSIELKSGINFLNDVDFSRLSSHPDYTRYVEWEAIKVQESDAPVDSIPLSDVPANLSAYSPKKAESIVDDTYDVDVLKRWLEAESRVTVKRVLEGRIQDLSELA